MIDDSDIRHYLKTIGKVPLLTREDEVRLAKEMEAGGPRGERAKEEFINANLRLVVWVAKKWPCGRILPLEDRIAIGNFGLIRAVEKFDWRRGSGFSTFARWSIFSHIQRESDKECRRRDGLRLVSLNQLSGLDSGDCLEDIVDDHAASAEFARVDDAVTAVQICSLLSAKQSRTLLASGNNREIAAAEGLTHQAISMRRANALRTLRRKRELLT